MTAPHDVFADEPLSLRGPADVLAALPFCLGYRPVDSVVAISLRAVGSGRRLGLVARADTADVLADPTCAERLRRHLVHDTAREALLVLFADRPVPGAQTAVARMADRWEAAGLPVADCLVVAGDDWWSLRDEAVAGSPGAGLDRSPVPAEMVWRGVSTVPTRQDRLSIVEPASRRRVEAVMRHAALARERADDTRDFRSWRRLRATAAAERGGCLQPPPTARSVGEVAGALGRVRFRDVLLLETAAPEDLPLPELVAGLDRLGEVLDGSARPRAERVDVSRDVFARLARETQGEVRGDALAALAWVEWYAGDLGFARDLALAATNCSPAQSLAGLIRRVAAVGMAPEWARPDRVSAIGGKRD